MTIVKILVKGYYQEISKDQARVCATVSLAQDEKVVMVVDPGTLENKDILLSALKQEGLTPNDVTHVGITHSHIDHYINAGLFPNATVLEYWGLWNKDVWGFWQEHFSNDIRIVKTPGHDYSCITFFVTTDDGVVAICGDVFFEEGKPEIDPFAADAKKLQESRKLILKTADWIIPGHGDIYRNKKL